MGCSVVGEGEDASAARQSGARVGHPLVGGETWHIEARG